MSNINESIVLIGGGGGVYRVARFLKHIRKNITTVQTMFDYGGHSKRLRDERGMLPPSDIRQGILALADDSLEGGMRFLLSYRFEEKNDPSLDRATLGNLILTALTEYHDGNIVLAINDLCRLCRVKGKVLPVSIDHANLSVILSDGSTLTGEGLIDTRSHDDNRTIVSARLEPKANIYVGAYEAIVKADKILFCPGDLFTSIIPTTLTEGFVGAIAESKAQLIFAVNIMTKKAETHRFPASRFAEVLLSYIGRDRFDAVIVNNGSLSASTRAAYRKERAYPVRIDHKKLGKFATRIIEADLVDEEGRIVRHNKEIASLLAEL